MSLPSSFQRSDLKSSSRRGSFAAGSLRQCQLAARAGELLAAGRSVKAVFTHTRAAVFLLGIITLSLMELQTIFLGAAVRAGRVPLGEPWGCPACANARCGPGCPCSHSGCHCWSPGSDPAPAAPSIPLGAEHLLLSHPCCRDGGTLPGGAHFVSKSLSTSAPTSTPTPTPTSCSC